MTPSRFSEPLASCHSRGLCSWTLPDTWIPQQRITGTNGLGAALYMPLSLPCSQSFPVLCMVGSPSLQFTGHVLHSAPAGWWPGHVVPSPHSRAVPDGLCSLQVGDLSPNLAPAPPVTPAPYGSKAHLAFPYWAPQSPCSSPQVVPQLLFHCIEIAIKSRDLFSP